MPTIGDRVQLANGERGTVTDDRLGADCRNLHVELDGGGGRTVDLADVEPIENKQWPPAGLETK